MKIIVWESIINKIAICLIFYILTSIFLFQVNASEINNFENLHVTISTYYPERDISLNDLLKKDVIPWKSTTQRDIQLIPKTEQWIKLKLSNHGKKAESGFIYSNITLINSIEFHLIKDRKVSKSQFSGTKHSNKNQVHKSMRQSFFFSLEGHESIIVLIKINPIIHNNILLLFNNETAYYKEFRLELTFLGFYFGFVIALFFVNLFIFIYMRNPIHGAYLGFISTMFITVLLRSGYWNMQFGEILGIPTLTLLAPMLIINSAIVFKFSADFLQLTRSYPKTEPFIKYIAWIGILIAFLLLFFDPSHAIEISSHLISIAVLVMFIFIAILQRNRGFAGFNYFLIARSIFMFTALIWLGYKHRLIPNHFFTQYAVLFGQLIETVILSVGVSAQMAQIQLKKLSAEKRAQDRDRLRDLLRIITHDLANPLSVAYHYAVKQIKDVAVGKVVDKKNSHSINKSLTRMKNIIDKVREMTAVEEGKKTINMGPVNIANIIEDSIFLFDIKSAEKQVQINSNHSNFPDTYVSGDSVVLMNTVFSNAISNAIKFSEPKSSINIEIEEDVDKVVISVIDQGIGIPKNILDQIFNAEAKTSRPGTSGESGTGFGMPLVKTYLEQLGGHIYIDSKCVTDVNQDDHGTSVIISLQKSQ